MDKSQHIHRLSFSWSVGNILLGAFILFISIGTLTFSAQELFSGEFGIMDYVGMLLMVFIIFPVGLLLFSTPFVTKIVINPHGLEYHTAVYVLVADWKQLVNIGYVKNTNTGKSLVVIPQDGKLVVRNWAKPFPSIFVHNLKDVEILVSKFRTFEGHTLETDILVNISQHGELIEDFDAL